MVLRLSTVFAICYVIFAISHFCAGSTMNVNDSDSCEGTSAGSCNTKKDGVNKDSFLTLCTTVRNNVHFIVEWIEYMRIQGVDRFVIYDDESTDNLSLLIPFYQQRDPALDITVRPRIINESNYHRQLVSLQHCLETYGKQTEWLLVSDTDEYFYAPSHPTFRAMLEDIPRMEKEKNVVVQNIQIDCSRFGSSGRLRRHQYRFELLPNGTVIYSNGCGEELMVNQVQRAPDHSSYRKGKKKERKLFEKLRNDPVCTRTAEKNGAIGCHYDPGKSVHRPRHVTEVAVHYPAAFADGHTEFYEAEGNFLLGPKKPLGWCNHYWFRSREDGIARATEQWMQAREDVMMAFYDDADLGVYGQVNDTLVRDKWGAELARRVRALSTYDGECPFAAPDTKAAAATGNIA